MDWPGEKLCIRIWETLEKCGTGLASPWQIRREGRAYIDVRREEAISDAQTQREIDTFRKQLLESSVRPRLVAPTSRLQLSAPESKGHKRRHEPQLSLPLSARKLAQLSEARRQCDDLEKLLNLRAVHRMAEEEASTEEVSALPDQRVGRDWTQAWREGAEQVSEKHLQILWARLLSGEVASPGTYSLRTLHTLRTLSTSEASALNAIAPYALDGAIHRISKEPTSVPGIPFSDIFLLEESGILAGSDGSIHTEHKILYQSGHGFYTTIALNKNESFMILFSEEISKGKGHIEIPAYIFTSVGRQILRLARYQCSETYLSRLAEYFREIYPQTFVRCEIFTLGESISETARKVIHRKFIA